MRLLHNRLIPIATLVIAICLQPLSSANAQCTGDCGDANGNGTLTSSDWQAIMEYMWFGITPPGSVACADIDGHQDVTVSDAHLMMRCLFLCDPPEAFFNCNAPSPPLVPVPTDSILIYYASSFPAGDSSNTVNLRLHTEMHLAAMTIPLRVSVNGALPNIEVLQTDPNEVWDIDTFNIAQPAIGAGEVLLGFENLSFSQYDNDDPLAQLKLTLPPDASDRIILLEYIGLPPSNVAMALTDAFEFADALEPHLFPCGVEVFGDANQSGEVNTQDLILTIWWLYKIGVSPSPCAAASDVNCSGSVTSSDVIYLVNYMFKSGPAPCNVCELIGGGTWSCP